MTATRGRGLPSALVDAVEDGMHELKAHGSRQRGLFPLPCENDVRKMRSGLSRGFRQRAGRRRELCERVSEMAHALNSLHEMEDFPAAQRTSPAQDEARRVLHRAAEACRFPRAVFVCFWLTCYFILVKAPGFRSTLLRQLSPRCHP